MLNVYYSNRMESLLEGLCSLIEDSPGDPFTQEIVSVQSLEMRTWLSMRLAEHFGFFANTRMPLPRDLMEELFLVGLGDVSDPALVMTRDDLTWKIMTQLQSLLDKPGFSDLKAYIDGDLNGRKALSLSEKIGNVFDMYTVLRPDLLLSWERGKADGWQSTLWKAISETSPSNHFATLAAKLERASKNDDLIGPLPKKINIFGVTTLPPAYLKVLVEISTKTNVNLFLLVPTKEYFVDIRKGREPSLDSKAFESFTSPNPLIASMGKLGRDFQQIFLEASQGAMITEIEQYIDPYVGASSMLEIIQSDILNLVHRRKRGSDFSGDPVSPVTVNHLDKSISVHRCYNPMREIEVLKDQLLLLLDDHDQLLQPQDVVVMAPEIETYAPLIEAVFGGNDRSSKRIPFRVSDRFSRGEEAAVDSFLGLLSLLKSRFALEDVFDVLSKEPIQSKFGLSDIEVETCRGLAIDAGIRWGIDEHHRKAHGQPALRGNTWEFGLNRLMLGYAAPANDKNIVFGVLPHGSIEGSECELLGKLDKFCELIFEAKMTAENNLSLSEWRVFFERLLDDTVEFTAQTAHQRVVISGELARQEKSAEGAGFSDKISFDVMLDLLNKSLGARKSSRTYLSSGVTFCSLQPMRSIPFKVLCLLGMNDNNFPGDTTSVGFDLMRRDPRPGDRSQKTDDRFLFLESILSARSNLLIFYTGYGALGGEQLPPSVVVSEFLDVIDESFCMEPEETLVSKVVHTDHPLQPFSVRYFDGSCELFSYEEDMCFGAEAVREASKQQVKNVFTKGVVPHGSDKKREIYLSELVRFFSSPAKYFLRKRLGISFKNSTPTVEPREPLIQNKLESYNLDQALLTDLLSGEKVDVLYQRYCAMGVLPLGTVGRHTFEENLHRAKVLSEEYFKHLDGELLPELELNQTFCIQGVEICIRGSLDSIGNKARVQGSAGKVQAKRQLEAWINHLALNAQAPAMYPKKSIWIGRSDKDGQIKTITIPPLFEARDILEDLLNVFLLGSTEPLRFTPSASLSYATKIYEGKEDMEIAAFKAARAGFDKSFEGNNLFTDRAFRGTNIFDAAPLGEGTSFGDLAERVFLPYLNCVKGAGS